MGASTRALGVDVSHYHPVTDFTKLMSAGVSFVGIKATEGKSFKDPKLKDHRSGFRTNPFKLGVYYHFARPGDPKDQANFFMDTVGQLLPKERLCLDFEDDKNGLPTVDLKFIDTFYTTLMGGICADRPSMIYTSKRVWSQIGNPTWALASDVHLWAPRYGTYEPDLPAPWKAWTFWQFSEAESFDGVPGTFDANYFNGDEAALDAYAKIGAPPVAPPTTGAPLVA
jgi:GH25 family lysozyme M1 (1,4-beta-N-acetylmuramidase)